MSIAEHGHDEAMDPTVDAGPPAMSGSALDRWGDAAISTPDHDLTGAAVWVGRDLGWEELLDHARELGPDQALVDVSDEDLDRRVRCQAAELAAATCRWLELLAELVVRGLWAGQGVSTPAQWLAWKIGLAPSTARDHVRVALQLRGLPLIRARFRAGQISYSKVRALTRVAVPDIEPMLLTWADHATASEIERVVTGYRRVQRGKAATPAVRELGRGVSQHHLDDGLVELRVRLLPEEALEARASLERLVDLEEAVIAGSADAGADGPSQPELGAPSDGSEHGVDIAERSIAPRQHRGGALADAFVAAVTSAVAEGPPDTSGADRHTLVIHADADDLADGPEAAEVVPIDEPSGRQRAMDRRVLRRLACEAGLTVVARDRQGSPIDIGRRDRRLTAALRRALMARDRSCRFPGCGATRHLHAHHIHHWADGGRTDLANLVVLCSTHHRYVHEHGWTIVATGTGSFTFSPPGEPSVASVAVLPDPRTADPDDLLEVPAIDRPDQLQPVDWHGPGAADIGLTIAVLDQELRRVLPTYVTEAA